MIFKIDDIATIPEICILEVVSSHITLDKEQSDCIHIAAGNPLKSHLICMLLDQYNQWVKQYPAIKEGKLDEKLQEKEKERVTESYNKRELSDDDSEDHEKEKKEKKRKKGKGTEQKQKIKEKGSKRNRQSDGSSDEEEKQKKKEKRNKQPQNKQEDNIDFLSIGTDFTGFRGFVDNLLPKNLGTKEKKKVSKQVQDYIDEELAKR